MHPPDPRHQLPQEVGALKRDLHPQTPSNNGSTSGRSTRNNFAATVTTCHTTTGPTATAIPTPDPTTPSVANTALPIVTEIST